MIKSTDRLRESEIDWNRALYSTMEYPEALERFAALWEQAARVHQDIGMEWEEDIKADITLARVLNGLPAHT